MDLQGKFLDTTGLTFRCSTLEGVTDADYTYSYKPGVGVIFSIGSLVMGETMGKPVLTIANLLPVNTPIFDTRLINRARLLYSLSRAQGFEEPIIIDTKVRNIISKHASQIDLDAQDESRLDDVLSKICAELGTWPKSVPHTRNHLRRAAAGFKVMRDVRIPVRDGSSILGDVYLPLEYGKRYPVLLSCTIYGRRIICSGPDLQDDKDIMAFEKVEDDWYSTSAGIEVLGPDDRVWRSGWACQRGFENIATFNTYTYVPRGYAMVKIDPRGVSQTPGTRNVPGQLATDFFDAVQWAAEQSWSNGTSALVGSSFGANSQWAVAQMKPKGLKCFVPYATDTDVYREATYPGGIPHTPFLVDWSNRVKRASPKWKDNMELLKIVSTQPFYNDVWQGLCVDPGKSDLPCFLAASQIFIIHGRGAYEAWRVMNHEQTHLQVADRNYYPWPSNEASGKILQFLDRHLKGAEHTNLERVGIQMRLGNKTWYWRKENDWPVPGTQYTKWYLRGDGTLSTRTENEPDKRLEYCTKVPQGCKKSGISFQSPPFKRDVEFAGHFSATLSVSSSMPDEDVVVTLWAVDEQGNAIPFGADGEPEPLAKGFLRVSHRKLDPWKTLPERPWHSHRQDDYAPLNEGEVVPIEVEIFPAAGRVRRGWRLRLDISPSEEQPDIPGYRPQEMREFYGEVNPEGVNAVHLGGGCVNYISCPVVPLKHGYPNIM